MGEQEETNSEFSLIPLHYLGVDRIVLPLLLLARLASFPTPSLLRHTRIHRS